MAILGQKEATRLKGLRITTIEESKFETSSFKIVPTLQEHTLAPVLRVCWVIWLGCHGSLHSA